MPKRVLIADDNPSMRKFVRSVFEYGMGLEVCAEAIDGVDAIEKATEFQPDLIVLDLSMPRMHGLEAGRRLKEIMPAVPLVLFTMHENVVSEKEAASAGLSAVVSKSDGVDALVSAVQKLFRAPSAAAASGPGN